MDAVVNTPALIGRGFNRVWFTRGGSRNFNPNGIAVLDEDWDYLIILDAARYDLFSETLELPGSLESRISRGSNTAEFLKGNFSEGQAHDTIYICGNPRLAQLKSELNTEFHAEFYGWDECWDSTLNTVHPADFTEYSLDLLSEFPNKRAIIHFIQPHTPFVAGPDEFDRILNVDTDHLRQTGKRYLWFRLMTGELDIPDTLLWEAYKRNLEFVEPWVGRLLDEVEGKFVVTSDHGNLVGERVWPVPIKEWGHPRGVYVEHLIKVPWQIIDSQNRPQIIAEQPQTSPKPEFSYLTERLEHLGYRM